MSSRSGRPNSSATSRNRLNEGPLGGRKVSHRATVVMAIPRCTANCCWVIWRCCLSSTTARCVSVRRFSLDTGCPIRLELLPVRRYYRLLVTTQYSADYISCQGVSQCTQVNVQKGE